MNRCTRKDKISNEYIWEEVRVTPIIEYMMESHLRWFGHLNRRLMEA